MNNTINKKFPIDAPLPAFFSLCAKEIEFLPKQFDLALKALISLYATEDGLPKENSCFGDDQTTHIMKAGHYVSCYTIDLLSQNTTNIKIKEVVLENLSFKMVKAYDYKISDMLAAVCCHKILSVLKKKNVNNNMAHAITAGFIYQCEEMCSPQYTFSRIVVAALKNIFLNTFHNDIILYDKEENECINFRYLFLDKMFSEKTFYKKEMPEDFLRKMFVDKLLREYHCNLNAIILDYVHQTIWKTIDLFRREIY
jgi:hypothetical protein